MGGEVAKEGRGKAGVRGLVGLESAVEEAGRLVSAKLELVLVQERL